MARNSASGSRRKPGRWITPATQERSRRTLAAILNAAERLLNEKPFDEITISEICRAAGCSPPAFYQRFRDKEALLHAIHERWTDDSIALVERFLDPGPWTGQRIEKLVRTLVQGVLAMESRSGGLRTTAVRRSFSDERFAERIRAIRHELYSHLARVLRQLSDQISHPDPEHAARFLVRLIQGVGARHYEGPHLEDRDLDPDELIDDLTRVALDYLGAEPDSQHP